MNNAIILHGIYSEKEYYKSNLPSPSNAHWIPWLQRELIRNNILCQTPEMPDVPNANYDGWKKVFEQFQINENTIFVGHSAGCGFILKWLNENPNFKFKKLILVAPWLDFDHEFQNFSNFTLNIDIAKQANEVHLICSTDDDTSIIKTTKYIMEKSSKFKYHEYTDKQHFTIKTTGEKFEDLLKICIN